MTVRGNRIRRQWKVATAHEVAVDRTAGSGGDVAMKKNARRGFAAAGIPSGPFHGGGDRHAGRTTLRLEDDPGRVAVPDGVVALTREGLRAQPPDILLTTPESLSLLLSYPDSFELFRGLRRIVIDEIHAFATGKRAGLYCFTNDTAWANYESIQADIFDHLYAILPEFGLRVFQEPSGADIGDALKAVTAHAA